jgi:cell division protease FtsH
VSSQGDVIQGRFERAIDGDDEGSEGNVEFATTRPLFAEDDRLLQELREQDVQINAQPIDSGRSFLGDLLLFFGPTLLLVGLFVILMRRAGGGGAAA